MAFEMFCIEVPNDGEEIRRLNTFLARSRVVSKQEHLVERNGVPYMMVWLEYIPREAGDMPSSNTRRNDGEGNDKQDVWEELDAAQRELFNKLRELRNAIATEEHVKPFAVFTNNQLGEMVRHRTKSIAELRTIPRVGEASLKKYADRLLPLLRELFGTEEATSEKPGVVSGSIPGEKTGVVSEEKA